MTSQPRTDETRRGIAHDAGLRGISLFSIVAGVVTAYGTFAIVAAIVGASLQGSGVDTDFRTNDWTGSGAIAALASAGTLLVAYLFGGYVAGRMARRNATLHGIAVFVLSLIAGAVAGAVVSLVSDNDELKSNLQSIGVPTSTNQIKGVAIAAAAVSLAAILIGSVLGAILGERWHTKLARRAADPDYEAEAEAEAEARAEHAEADRQARLERDEAVRRQHEDRDDAEEREAEQRRLAEQQGAEGQHEREVDPRHSRDRELGEQPRDRQQEGEGRDWNRDDTERNDQVRDNQDQGDRSTTPLADDPDWQGGAPPPRGDAEPVRYTEAEWRQMEQQRPS